MAQLTYEPLKAVVQHFSWDKRLRLSKSGGVFVAIDKVVPYKYPDMEINNYGFKVDGNSWFIPSSEKTVSYSLKNEFHKEFELKTNMEEAMQKLCNYWIRPCTEIGYLNIWSPPNLSPPDGVKMTVNTVNIADPLGYEFVRSFNLHANEIILSFESKKAFSFFNESNIKNCYKLILTKKYSNRMMLDILNISNNRHLHFDSYYWNGNEHLFEIVEMWKNEFRSIGRTFSFEFDDFFKFVEFIEELLENRPGSFRSRDPLMDINAIYSKGITIPLSEERELMINSDYNHEQRRICDKYISRYRGFRREYIFQMRVLKKGHTVPLPII